MSNISPKYFEAYQSCMTGFRARMRDLKTCKAKAILRGNRDAIERIDEKIKKLNEAQQKIYKDVTHLSGEEDFSESDESCDNGFKSSNAGDLNESNDVDDDSNDCFGSGEDEYERVERQVYDDSDSLDQTYEPESESEESDEEGKNYQVAICHSRRLGKKKKEKKVDNSGGTKRKRVDYDTSGAKGICTTAKCKREKKKCPLCNAKVFHLPRHMRNKHKWSTEKSKTVLQHYNIRKLKSKKDNYKKDYHIKKHCPLANCSSVVLRISDHLLRVHKLKKNSRVHKLCLKTATKVHQNADKKDQNEEMQGKVERVVTAGQTIEQEEPKSDDNFPEHDGEIMQSKYKVLNLETKEQHYLEEDEFESDDELLKQEQSCNTKTSEIFSSTAILHAFNKWMKTPDGGKQDDKTANQHTKQLQRVLEIIDQELNLSSLLDYKRIRDAFITGHAEKNYHPKTIKSYIMSIRHFLSFLLSDEPISFPFNRETTIMLRERLQRWTKSYKKECQKREWEKKESDRDRIITPDKIGDFESSKAARKAIILLGMLSGACEGEITQADYTLVRDFLLTEISIDNANRAGVVANMTLQEFQKAVPMENEDSFIIEVMRHKTLESKGPANIVLSKKLHSWMKIFETKLRSKLERPGKAEEFFLSWNGKKLESSQINKALKSVWKKAEISGTICSTDFRKSAVTEIHKNYKEHTSNLADLLDHNEATAKKYYRLTEKNTSTLKASKHLAKVMRSEVSSPKPQLKTVEHSKDSPFKEDLALNAPVQDDEKDSSKRTLWTAEAVDNLRLVFAQEIKEQKVTIAVVRQKIAQNPVLVSEDARRVLHKVRTMWRYAPESTSKLELPSEDEPKEMQLNRMLDTESVTKTSVISPTEVSVSNKGIFSELHKEIVLNMFKDMIKGSIPISRNLISERLKSDKVQGKQLSALTSYQLINRIKYERRMHRERKR